MIDRVQQFFTRTVKRPPVLDSLDAYARWAATYSDEAHNVLMETEEAAMRTLMPPLAGQVILDLASGSGRYGRLAQADGASSVLAIDNSGPMLARSRLSSRILASCEALPLPDACVDGVICALALGHLPRLQPSIDEIGRVLRPGGWALVSDFHPLMFYSGGQRTFQSNGQTFAVEHYPHLYAAYHAAASAAGCIIDAVLEPVHSAAGNRPIVIVYRLRRGSS